MSHSSSRVSKQYDAASRGTVFCLSAPTSFLSLPTHPKPAAPSLLQPFLVLQLALAPATSPSSSPHFSLHLALLSTSHLTYSVVLSTSVSSVALHPFGADLPLSLPIGAWLNVCVPVRDLLWDALQIQYAGVESLTLRGQCKVRRVFGMRHAVDTVGGRDALEGGNDSDSDELLLRYERRESVPAEHDFDPDVLHTTLFYSQHLYANNRRLVGHGRRRPPSFADSGEERADEARRRVAGSSRAAMPYNRSRASAIEPQLAPSSLQWEESIEATAEPATAAAIHRNAPAKPTTGSKRSTQPLPTRSLTQQPAHQEKLSTSKVPTSYQMIPYTEPSNAPSDSIAARKPSSSPPASRQLQRDRRNERRRTSEDKPDNQRRQQRDRTGLVTVNETDASAGLVFHPAVARSAAASPLSPSSSALPTRPPAPSMRTAAPEVRPRSPVHVRRPPTLIRTYTAPESIDVQHNVVGRERRDSRGEERREDEEDEVTQVPMERAGTAEVYTASPVVREQDRRMEQRQHRRSRRRREERRVRGEDEQQLPLPQSHVTFSSAARDHLRSSIPASHSFAFRPDLSSAESTPNSTSATSSLAASRRPSLSSSSASSSAVPMFVGSDLSSNTVSLSTTPFASLPSSPTIRSARSSLIAHAVTSHQSAPSSRRQSVQTDKEKDSGRQRRTDDEIDDERHRKDEKSAQRRSSSTSRPITAQLPRVAQSDTSRPSSASPTTAATVTPAFTSTFPSSVMAVSSYAPVPMSALSAESAATSDIRPAIASLFSSPSASVSSWPAVSTGPSSPPPFSTLRSTLPPFSFISKLDEPASSPAAATFSSTVPLPSFSSASMPVSSSTTPMIVSRPLSSISQPVSPSRAVSADWARTTMSDDARRARDKALNGAVAAGGDRAQERVLEEIEEEEVNEGDEPDEDEAEEDDVAPAEDEDESTREDNATLREQASGDMGTPPHSDRSHRSNSSVSRQSHNNSSPTSARAMAVSQHLRRLSMQDSSFDEPEDEQAQQETVEDEEEEETKHDEDELEQSEDDMGCC